MFLIREIYFPNISFIFNGLFWSLSTLIVAMWRMKARGISWADIGLTKPKSYKKTAIATVVIPIFAIGTIVLFGILKDQFQLEMNPDTSGQEASSKFGNLHNNWILFFSIIPFIWIQSALEEMLDRGFLINWVERVFSSSLFATIFAVVFQAVIFGFRHSNDFSERSITTGLIGLAMGIGYVVFGRNLWPLILAHCALNTLSMIGRVL